MEKVAEELTDLVNKRKDLLRQYSQDDLRTHNLVEFCKNLKCYGTQGLTLNLRLAIDKKVIALLQASDKCFGTCKYLEDLEFDSENAGRRSDS